jgi:hypothetical protein
LSNNALLATKTNLFKRKIIEDQLSNLSPTCEGRDYGRVLWGLSS